MFMKHLVAVALVAGLTGLAAGPADAAGHESKSQVVASGTFEGRSSHETSGGVSILKTASGHVAVLEGDFSLDGAPDPTLGFGKSGSFAQATEFTELKSNTGLQVYAIPDGVNPSDFDEFYVWCRKFSVPLGVAALAH